MKRSWLVVIHTRALTHAHDLMLICKVIFTTDVVQIIRDTTGVPEVLTRLDMVQNPIEEYES